MKEAKHDEQLEVPAVGFVFANIAHMRCFIQPGTKHQVLYDYCMFLVTTVLGYFFSEGGIGGHR